MTLHLLPYCQPTSKSWGGDTLDILKGKQKEGFCRRQTDTTRSVSENTAGASGRGRPKSAVGHRIQPCKLGTAHLAFGGNALLCFVVVLGWTGFWESVWLLCVVRKSPETPLCLVEEWTVVDGPSRQHSQSGYSRLNEAETKGLNITALNRNQVGVFYLLYNVMIPLAWNTCRENSNLLRY